MSLISYNIGSYLGGNLVDKVNSPLNGELYVYHINGRYLLNAKSTNYSFGELHTGFQKAFKHIGIDQLKINNCLVLGFGTGSVVSIIREEYKLNFPIIAIEKDPVVIKLGKKYFNIERFQNLQVLPQDAATYVLQNKQLFDLIVFDIYINDIIPSYFESIEFLHALKKQLTPTGMLLFNKDVNNPSMNASLLQLETNLNTTFPSVEKFQLVKNNYFFRATI
mgnify:FL=1